jgi:hypothetical protein
MRRAVLALTAVAVIMFLMAPLAQMVVVTANPYSFIKPHISVDSPDVAKAEIYQTTSIPIEVSAYPGPNINLVDLFYSLDGGPNIKLSIITYETSAGYFGRGTLENLTNGYHTLRAHAYDAQGKIITYQGNILSGSTTFLVNTTLRLPTILLSPLNITYYSNEMPLTYSIDNSSYHVYYRLDNSTDKRIDSNLTLSALSEGQHTIEMRAYGNDVNIGIYTKQTANFTIDTKNPTPTQTQTFPEVPTTLAILFLFIAALAVSVSFRRMKTKHEQ